MTNSQQQIIDSLINEFERINQANDNQGGFNLININELNRKTNIIKEWKAMEDADAIAWEKSANDECYRIIKLLQQDLPNARIEKYGASNQHYDIPNILIAHPSVTNYHHENIVSIEVHIKKEWSYDEFKNGYKFGVRFEYSATPMLLDYNKKYQSVEELFQDTMLIDALRRRVIR